MSSSLGPELTFSEVVFAATFAAFCKAFSFRRAAAASFSFYLAVFVVSIMIRTPGAAFESDSTSAERVSFWFKLGAGLAAARDALSSGYFAAQSWHLKGKFSMSTISAYFLKIASLIKYEFDF